MNGLHGIIFSYEQEPGLRELAERRMPASIPFGGRYRVVDFMLSNLHAAGITDIGVVLHGNYQSLAAFWKTKSSTRSSTSWSACSAPSRSSSC